MGGDSNPFDHYTLDFNLNGGGTGIDLGLDNVRATLAGAVDFGLEEIADALTKGIKATVDAGLNEIRIKELATAVEAKITQLVPVQLQAAVTELPVIRTDSKVDLGLDDIRIAELPPVQLEFAVRPVRVHLPLNFSFSFELFGLRLCKFSVCGEAMVVSEDFKPHATERCE